MNPFSRAVPLQSGISVTVVAWPYQAFVASYADYRTLLRLFRERAAGGDDHDMPEQALIDRVVLASVPSAEDRQQISGRDLPGLLSTIFEVNCLEDVAAKPLGLYMRLLKAETSSMEPPPAPSAN